MTGTVTRVYTPLGHKGLGGFYVDLRVSALQLPPATSMNGFNMVTHKPWSDDRLILESVAVFAVYSVHNQVRLHGFTSAEACADALVLACYHAVRNHPRSTAALTRARTSMGIVW